ncbi:hypothetical protein J0910_15655 [Nocardiopsis sp. CNT-189]|uniref:hypothetical protein n=1 Tax=Nocardiopsis oceanisediminis TaxID=2816862 RepID=UPI003B2EF048
MTPPGSGRIDVKLLLSSLLSTSLLIAATLFALPLLAFTVFAGLVESEPPACFMPMEQEGQAACEEAREEGYHSMRPYALFFLAALEVAAVSAGWALCRRPWAPWAVLAALAAIAAAVSSVIGLR